MPSRVVDAGARFAPLLFDEAHMRKQVFTGVVTAVALWPAVTLAQSPAAEGYREGYRDAALLEVPLAPQLNCPATSSAL
jgi:hypothetical protein